MTILDAQHDLPAFRHAIRDWLAEVVPGRLEGPHGKGHQ